MLQGKRDKRSVALAIGLAEATGIAVPLQGVTPPRPLTHDLFLTMFGRLKVSLTRVVITDLRDDIFYAIIYLNAGGPEFQLDARRRTRSRWRSARRCRCWSRSASSRRPAPPRRYAAVDLTPWPSPSETRRVGAPAATRGRLRQAGGEVRRPDRPRRDEDQVDGHLRRRRRAPGGEDHPQRIRARAQRARPLPAVGHRAAEGAAPLRTAGHREIEARAGARHDVGRDLLSPEAHEPHLEVRRQHR